MPSKKLIWILEIILVTSILASVYLPHIDKVEFHSDESLWIAGSGMFESYLRLEFNSKIWDVSYTTVTQPPIARYIAGLGRYIGGYRRPDLNRPWDDRRGRAFNERAGAVPSAGLLWWSRLPMVILTMLSIGLGFLLLRKSTGVIAAYVWLGLFMISPYFLLTLRRAMGESPLVFFTMLTLYLSTQALDSAKELDSTKKRNITSLFLLAGITSGLAWASKLNGIITLGTNLVVAVLVGFMLNTELKKKIMQSVRYSLITSAACIFTFLAVYPFLWRTPLERTLMMFRNRTQEMSQQTTLYSGSYMTPVQRFTIIPTRVFHDYASLPIPAIFNFILTALGLLITLLALRSLLARQDFKSAYITLPVMAFLTSAPIWLSQLDWDRYYIYPVLFATAFTAIAIDWLIHTGWHAGKKFISRSTG
ncbi:MAG: phospholipid carrier-dependent glycosyltransferase [Chloroflexota bacterium]